MFPNPTRSRICSSDCRRWSASTASATSSGTTTATSPIRCIAAVREPAGRPSTIKRSPLTGLWRNCASGTRALRSSRVRPGGSRIDFGVLEHTDRVWASDCIDPYERVRIVSGISTLLPFELIGAHVASGRNHTTGRTHELSFRLAVALFGHAGLEWDLTTTSPEVREQLAAWVAFAKSVRQLLRTGELVRVDRPADHETVLYGVVSPQARRGAVQSRPTADRSPLRHGAGCVRRP